MSQNTIQKGERHYAESVADWHARYPGYSSHFEGHVYLTCLANSKEAIERTMTRSFSDYSIISRYEELGADLSFKQGSRGCSLLEFDATYRAFFQNHPRQIASHPSFAVSFAEFSEQHPEVLFVADLLNMNDATRHSKKRCVFSKGSIEITTPTIAYSCSNAVDEGLNFASAYSKYLVSEKQKQTSELEELLYDALVEIDPEIPEIVG